MATIVKLQRTNPNEPWGFRIHGGRDFNQPIIVLKVTAGTLASSSGLTPGDQLASINGRDAGSLSHKDAEALIKNAGNEVAIGVYKTTQSTWKPNVQVLQQPNGGSGGESGSVLVNKQFNTPIAMYSEQSIAETLSAQAEVLAGGAIGVNFKKNEKKYNYENSEVYKMLQEVENERPSSAASNTGAGDFQQQQQQHSGDYSGASPGRTSASFVTNQSVPYANVLNRQQQPQQQPQQQQQQVPQQQQQFQPVVQQIQQQQIIPQQLQQQQPSPAAAPSAAPAGPIQQVTAPVTGTGGPPPPSAGGGSNVCADCERLIVGVFVRIKDKNLHVECFKCSTCGQSLKNVGYFNINNKLYCDIHAKTVARQNPPAPGLEPVTSIPKTPQA